MSGSGGSSYSDWDTSSLTKAVKEESSQASAQFEVELSGYLSELLAQYGKDTDLVRRRLDDCKNALQEELDESFDQLYGGSVAKHTYVDGLSDIDSLLIVNDSKFEELTPAKILQR